MESGTETSGISRRGHLWLAAAVMAAVLVYALGWPRWQTAQAEKPVPAPPPGPGATPAGDVLYKTHCLTCHGPAGRGDGPAAYLLWPRPRDFTRGLFKIRSTPTGALPTDEDLYRVITEGMPGSSMPAWRHLPEADRRALVQQVRAMTQFVDDEGTTFNFFAEREKVPPMAVPPEPPAAPDSIARGKAVYTRLECAKCHGETGRGDGPSAAGMKDDWGQPIRPNDYTLGMFKGGGAGRDLYLRIACGVGGTPMPAFDNTLMTDAERWDMVHFIQSMAGAGAKPLAEALKPGEIIRAARVAAGALPLEPTDAGWDTVPASPVALMLLFQRTDAPRTLNVQAVHDGRELAMRLSWNDATTDDAPLRPQDFRDAVAVQFALKGLDTPPAMGSAEKPVNLWHWKADWQADLAAYKDMETAYPGMVSEWYPYQKTGDGTNNKGSNPAPAPEHDPAFITAWGAGNLLANPGRKSPVEDAVAAGFGTLTSLPLERQKVSGKGVRTGDRWTVVMRRTLSAPEPGCAGFEPGREIAASFAVWDGAAGDRNGQKSVTTWYRLLPDP